MFLFTVGLESTEGPAQLTEYTLTDAGRSSQHLACGSAGRAVLKVPTLPIATIRCGRINNQQRQTKTTVALINKQKTSQATSHAIKNRTARTK